MNCIYISSYLKLKILSYIAGVFFLPLTPPSHFINYIVGKSFQQQFQKNRYLSFFTHYISPILYPHFGQNSSLVPILELQFGQCFRLSIISDPFSKLFFSLFFLLF